MNQQLIHKIESYDHIIWDWNGTIINDVDIAIKAMNDVLTHINLPHINKDQYLNKFKFPVSEYYQDIGIDISMYNMKDLAKIFHKKYEDYLDEITIFDGLDKLLESTKKSKHQSILSAGAQWLLDGWVDKYKVREHFDNIFGIDNIQATSKIKRGKELLEATPKHLHKSTLMIGDTAHDCEVAKSLNIDIMLVADGHQSYKRLKKQDCFVLESKYIIN